MLDKKIYEINSENDTKNLAKKLASSLQGDEIIVLTGELGSGKTKFTEGFLEYFGFHDISSPSFSIINEYDIKDEKTIYHFDVYRLEDEDEFFNIGGEEFFGKGICIIEWGEKIKDILPKKYIHIHIMRNFELEDNKREIEIEYIGY